MPHAARRPLLTTSPRPLPRPKARWRRLHLLYARALRDTLSTRPLALRDGRAVRRLQRQLEAQLAALVHGAEALRQARPPPQRPESPSPARTPLQRSSPAQARQLAAPCTGYAFVTFRRAQDAAKCVRHFELIRRHERSRDGASDNVDFRQLYYRSTHADPRARTLWTSSVAPDLLLTRSGCVCPRRSKLDVSRACEPSDIIWQNLQHGRGAMRKQNLKTTSLVLLVSLVSTSLITLVNVLVQTDHVAPGPLTTVWVTAVIILSNVIIFAMVRALAAPSPRPLSSSRPTSRPTFRRPPADLAAISPRSRRALPRCPTSRSTRSFTTTARRSRRTCSSRWPSSKCVRRDLARSPTISEHPPPAPPLQVFNTTIATLIFLVISW